MHTASEEITVINELCIHKMSSHMCENVNIPVTEFNDIMNLQWKISLHQAKTGITMLGCSWQTGQFISQVRKGK